MKTAAGVASIVLSLLATSALASPRPLSDAQMSQIVAGEKFTVVGEVSDTLVENGNPADPLLLNPWGISEGPGTPIWVSDNNSGFSTLYDPTNNFAKVPLNVLIPDGAADPTAVGSPTGTVFTDFSASDFKVNLIDPVTHTTVSTHALFLFDTEDGTISGWGEPAPGHFPTQAGIAVDLSTTGASFKGLTLADVGVGSTVPEIYAADFANNRVDVFDSTFKPLGSFTDPSLPAGYAPFNVQELNGRIYVAFAIVNPATSEGLPGQGLGFVDVFDLQGNKISTLVSNGQGSKLNAPWGLDIAPASFGKLAGALLVGNFGDGQVNAYDPNTGQFLGSLKNTGDNSIAITDLWTLRNGPDGEVIFSAGLTNQSHGLVGVIKPEWSQASWAYQSHVVLGH